MKKIQFGYSNKKNLTGVWDGICISPDLFLCNADYYGAVQYGDNTYIVAKVVEDKYNRYPELLGKFIVRPAFAELYPDGYGNILLDQEQSEYGEDLENYLNRDDIRENIKSPEDVLWTCREIGEVFEANRAFDLLTRGDRNGEFITTSVLHDVFEKKKEILKHSQFSFSTLLEERNKLIEEQQRLQESNKKLQEDYDKLKYDYTGLREKFNRLEYDYNSLQEDYNRSKAETQISPKTEDLLNESAVLLAEGLANDNIIARAEEILDINNGVTPIEQTTPTLSPEVALSKELTDKVTETPVVEERKTIDQTLESYTTVENTINQNPNLTEEQKKQMKDALWSDFDKYVEQNPEPKRQR